MRIHLYTVNGVGIGAAPIQIDSSVIITEAVGIPERKRRRNFFKFICHRIKSPQNWAVLIAPGGAEVEIFADLSHIWGIVIDQKVFISMKLPVQQVLTVPEASGHGNKEIIGSVEQNQSRISTFPNTAALAAFVVVLVTVR